MLINCTDCKPLVRTMPVVLLFLAAPWNAYGQYGCYSNSEAQSVKVTCECNNRVVYAGECQGADTPTACQFRSFYNCGVQGSEICQVAFAEDTGSCQPSGEVVVSRAQSVAPRSGLRAMAPKSLHSEISRNESPCLYSAMAFETWVKREEKAERNARLGVSE
jgi:hypothetical protein